MSYAHVADRDGDGDEDQAVHVHPLFWTLQDEVASLPADEDDREIEANEELEDILQYLFVERPGILPPGQQLVDTDLWESTSKEALEGRRAKIWCSSWARAAAFACVGTVCAAGLWSIPRWTWAERAIDEKWGPSVRGETLGRVGSYTALFTVLCILLAGVGHPLVVRSLVNVNK